VPGTLDAPVHSTSPGMPAARSVRSTPAWIAAARVVISSDQIITSAKQALGLITSVGQLFTCEALSS
jgi:hypothetical protein